MGVFDETVGLYFFSAVFQGNMALLALAGVFAVYRMQLVASREASVQQALVGYVQSTFDQAAGGVPTPLPCSTVERLMEHLHGLDAWWDATPGTTNVLQVTTAHRLLQDDKLKGMLGERERRIQERRALRSAMLSPLMVTSTVIIVSLAALGAAKAIAQLSNWLMLLALIGTGYLSSRALVSNMSFVLHALRMDIPNWLMRLSRICLLALPRD